MIDALIFIGACSMILYAVFFMAVDAAVPPGPGWVCTETIEIYEDDEDGPAPTF